VLYWAVEKLRGLEHKLCDGADWRIENCNFCACNFIFIATFHKMSYFRWHY